MVPWSYYGNLFLLWELGLVLGTWSCYETWSCYGNLALLLELGLVTGTGLIIGLVLTRYGSFYCSLAVGMFI